MANEERVEKSATPSLNRSSPTSFVIHRFPGDLGHIEFLWLVVTLWYDKIKMVQIDPGLPDMYWDRNRIGHFDRIIELTIKSTIMKKNMGKADRTLRIVLAAIFAVLYLGEFVTGTAGLVLMVLALVFLATAAIGTCPLYLPLGLKTCKTETA